MAPSDPKRPPRSGPPPAEGPLHPKATTEDELPFDASEVTPLRADDPAPQRVPQFPATQRRRRTTDEVPTQRMQIPRELTRGYGVGATETFRPVFLYVEHGPGAGQLLPAPQGRLLLGRSSSCDLRLQHPSISRRHAELTRTGERFFLRDLASQNGTFVNKARLVAEREVFAGDTLLLGTAILRLRGPVGQPAEATNAPHRSRTLTVALFACAVAIGLAGILASLHHPPAQQTEPAGSPPTVAKAAPGTVDAAGDPAPAAAAPEKAESAQRPARHASNGP